MAIKSWTKLKSRIEERFALSLKGRLRVHQARYRNTREEAGRIWFELDGVELASFATYPHKRFILGQELMRAKQLRGTPDESLEADEEAQQLLRLRGEQPDHAAEEDLQEALNLPIDQALSSGNPLIQSLALADARVGRRRLAQFEASTRAHPLVKAVLEARCAAEKIRRGAPAA